MRPKADPDMSTEDTERKVWKTKMANWLSERFGDARRAEHEKEMLELAREERCQHRDSGRGVCVECGAFL